MFTHKIKQYENQSYTRNYNILVNPFNGQNDKVYKYMQKIRFKIPYQSCSMRTHSSDNPKFEF